jgi:hypothetical protein
MMSENTSSPPRYEVGTPLEAPPGQSTSYQFVPVAGASTIESSMVLASDITETEGSYGAALFYISVKMNPFTPSSWITTIRTGSRSDGAIVADFE